MRQAFQRAMVPTLILWMLVSASGCQQAPHDAGLTVAAAGSLTLPFEELGQSFSRRTGIPVRFTFAATGNLAQQIRNGAPFDIFAAADAVHVDQLIEDGYLAAGTRRVYAFGELVLIQRPDLEVEIADLTTLLAPEIERIALANPDHAPYGIAARETLIELGLWETLQDRLVFGETVRQAAQLVETGNADAGLVAASSVSDQDMVALTVPPDLHHDIAHVLAENTATTHASQAARFVEFLLSEEGIALLARFHLNVPDTDPH